MAIFKCKMCGGALEINNETVAVCQYCGTKQTLPKLDDDRKANLYDRANHFRRNNEFDKAMGIYEQILNDDNADAETYWSLVLCRYGIEYVEDPTTHKRIPTVNRAQFTSIFDDEDYKSALQYADGYQKEVYEQEANAINDIQKGILAISQKEDPFDVFICYKETDNSGLRSPDSVLATELYNELTREGFKVFFARITLEDKLGQEYEPYIFAALNSAKVMVVLGTKPEYFNAVWVKNEWSRYLALIKNGARKMLIPAYKDMDPYDLPEEFSHLQAQDMSKLGFMQDLIRGIKKVIGADKTASTVVQNNANVVHIGNVAALLDRGYMALEDSEWDKADDFFEQVLNQDAKNANAYLGKLMAELHVNKQDELKDCPTPFNNSSNFNKIIRFANSELISKLNDCIEFINNRNRLQAEEEQKEKLYYSAMDDYKSYDINRLNNAIEVFTSISGYRDSNERVDLCKQKIEKIQIEEEQKRLEQERLAEEQKIKDEKIRIERERQEEIDNIAKTKRIKRNKKIIFISIPVFAILIAFIIVLNMVIIPNNQLATAKQLINNERYAEAYEILIGTKSNANNLEALSETKYFLAQKLLDNGDILKGQMMLVSLRNYKDSQSILRKYNYTGCNFFDSDLFHNIALKSDGTLLANNIPDKDDDEGQCNIENWKDIIAISTSFYHTVGLKKDGTVIAVGTNKSGQCNVESWKDIVAISAGSRHTVGLKSDGTVISTQITDFEEDKGQTKIEEWKNIKAIAVGDYFTAGLKSDGTVITAGKYMPSPPWTDIVAITAGDYHLVGLKSDGTTVATAWNPREECRVSNWEDVIAISAGYDFTVGLKSDGTVVTTEVTMDGHNCGKTNVGNWKNIVAISAGGRHTAGVKADGTVIAIGSNENNNCEVSGWNVFK